MGIGFTEYVTQKKIAKAKAWIAAPIGNYRQALHFPMELLFFR
jgi:hypothetical protein